MTEPETQETWERAIKSELINLPLEERFVRAGELISRITYSLLPDLGAMRRDCIVDLADNEWETMRIAEHFGMRRSTVIRLLEEGRAVRKHTRLKREALTAQLELENQQSEAA
jgi:hypothetical protein